MRFLICGWTVLGVAEPSGLLWDSSQTFALTLSGSHLESQAAAALVRLGLVCCCFLLLDLVLDRGAEPRLPGVGQRLWPWDFPVILCAVCVCLCKILHGRFWACGLFFL